MKALSRSLIVVTVLGITASGNAAPWEKSGGGRMDAGPPECISAVQREEMQKEVREYFASKGTTAAVTAQAAPEKFSFYPVGGNLYGDLITNNFVDLDPTAGILDWNCTDMTYDGHDASDVDIRSFQEQLLGVPIFAALDGTVVSMRDGQFDMNTSAVGLPNYVRIDHGNGRVCSYLHMKKWSVAVSVGEQVRAGQQIGMVGSSGWSSQPHIHFATYDFNPGINDYEVIEPYAGTCNPGESQWVNQEPISQTTYLRELHITDVLIENYDPWPFFFPHTGTFVQGVQPISLWIMLHGLTPNTVRHIQFRRPDGTIKLDDGTWSFGNQEFWTWGIWWWRWTLDLDMTGTWHIVFDINGQTLVEAPFEVVSSAALIVNHPPEPITWYMEPASPTESDTVFCRVVTDLVLDDRDYDVVRYHYVWERDGQIVRNVRHAGQADAVPAGTALPGTTLTCTVTPEDGADDCPPAPVHVPAEQVAKNRYLAFEAGNPGFITAIRVTLTDLPSPHGGAVGRTMWVGPPVEITENAGKTDPADAPSSPTFMAATLQCEPYYTYWETFGTLYLSHASIIPGGVYTLQEIATGCDSAVESNYSSSEPIPTSPWGDVVSNCATDPCGPPDGSIDITTDVTSILNKFKNLDGAPIKARSDLDLDTPDRYINISDVTMALNAFGGFGYPFNGPSPTDPCSP